MPIPGLGSRNRHPRPRHTTGVRWEPSARFLHLTCKEDVRSEPGEDWIGSADGRAERGRVPTGRHLRRGRGTAHRGRRAVGDNTARRSVLPFRRTLAGHGDSDARQGPDRTAGGGLTRAKPALLRARVVFSRSGRGYERGCVIWACAAASRAMGTRNGEQLT